MDDDDDDGKICALIFQIHYLIKMDNRLLYASLTSNVKRAHKMSLEA